MVRRARPICEHLTERGAVRAGQGASGDRKTHSHILMHPPPHDPVPGWYGRETRAMSLLARQWGL